MGTNSKGVEVAEIITDRCIGCQICVAECPVGAIDMREGTAYVDPEICIGCGKCFEVCPVEAVRFERKATEEPLPKAPAAEERAFSDYRDVAIFIEVVNGTGAPVSWELAAKAAELAAKRKARVIGLLLGHQVDDVAREAIAYGCDEVHVMDDPALARYLSDTYGKGLTDLCRIVKPEILLVGATPAGRDLAGIVATRIETGLTADCTGLDIDEKKGSPPHDAAHLRGQHHGHHLLRAPPAPDEHGTAQGLQARP